jgi:hypothetical protein
MTAKVYIYWNLHKRCFSAKRNGKVFAHFRNASILNPEFRVSAAGCRRVRRDGRKNVHANIVCEFENFTIHPNSRIAPVSDATAEYAYYNPYLYETFVDNEGNALYNARSAELTTYEHMVDYYRNYKVRQPIVYITKEANEPVQS